MNQEFYDWIEKAISKIVSPQKKKEARAKLMPGKAIGSSFGIGIVLFVIGLKLVFTKK